MNLNEKENCTFINGKIFTSNPDNPYASAMIVRNGRIDWIGEEADLERIDGPFIDLQGRRVLPGLIDAHLHPLWLAYAEKQIACTPPLIHSIEDMIEAIQKHRSTVKADDWIEGWGYDEGKLQEGRTPTRYDLDKATKDVPIIVTRTCTHIASVNSKALELAGITRNTLNPPGGEIDRDVHGEPTGILRELSAIELVTKWKRVKTLEEDATVLAELSPKLLSHGITTITDLMARRKPNDYIDIYNKAREKGLQQRAVLYYIWEDLKEQPVMEKTVTDRKSPIHIGGVKLFLDGSISGKTAWVTEPYLGEEGSTGIQVTTKEELLAAGKAAKENDVQLVVHAMGEQAIELIVDTFYGQEGWLSDAPSIRIEHAAMPSMRAIKLGAEAGIAYVPQPIFLYAEIESYLNNLGIERTKQTYPIKTMLEMGVKVAFSSDAPATAWNDPVNPFVGMKAAVTRTAYDGTDTGQAQKIDIATAITLYTRAAQEIIRIPDIGQLTPSYHADFIVLDQDILSIPTNEIDQVKVVEMYMGGKVVFKKGNE